MQTKGQNDRKNESDTKRVTSSRGNAKKIKHESFSSGPTFILEYSWEPEEYCPLHSCDRVECSFFGRWASSQLCELSKTIKIYQNNQKISGIWTGSASAAVSVSAAARLGVRVGRRQVPCRPAPRLCRTAALGSAAGLLCRTAGRRVQGFHKARKKIPELT